MVIYRIDALRKKQEKLNNIYIENDNKKLMSEIISTAVEKKKKE